MEELLWTYSIRTTYLVLLWSWINVHFGTDNLSRWQIDVFFCFILLLIAIGLGRSKINVGDEFLAGIDIVLFLVLEKRQRKIVNIIKMSIVVIGLPQSFRHLD